MDSQEAAMIAGGQWLHPVPTSPLEPRRAAGARPVPHEATKPSPLIRATCRSSAYAGRAAQGACWSSGRGKLWRANLPAVEQAADPALALRFGGAASGGDLGVPLVLHGFD